MFRSQVGSDPNTDLILLKCTEREREYDPSPAHTSPHRSSGVPEH
jgi:hypothetical protein